MFNERMSRRDFGKKVVYVGLGALLSPLVDSPWILPLNEVRKTYPKTYALLEGEGYSEKFINRFLRDPRLNVPERKEEAKKPGNSSTNGKKPTYDEYKSGMDIGEKIKNGRRFMQENALELERIENRFGVDKNYVVAILGMESKYGEKYEIYNAVSVYVTMIERTPEKERTGNDQLLELLRFCERNGKDPYSFRSSRAGAIGKAQFRASSLNKWFIDADGDGYPNPRSIIDSMASIGNLLKLNGWVKSGKIEPGSRNWKALFGYNHDEYFVMAVKEIAEGLNLH